MKTCVAVLAVVVASIGILGIMGFSVVQAKLDRLERRLASTASDTVGRDGEKGTTVEISSQSLDDTALAPAVAAMGERAEPNGIDGLRDQLVGLEKEISRLRDDIERSSALTSGLKQVVESLASASGHAPVRDLTESVEAGLLELASATSLFRKPERELTTEETSRIEGMKELFRRTGADWAVQEFDENLEERLTEQQRLSMSDIVASEGADIRKLRDEAGSREELAASRLDVWNRTDEIVKAVLSQKQYEEWTRQRAPLKRRMAVVVAVPAAEQE